MSEAKHTPGPWIAVEACEGAPLPVGVPCAVQTTAEPWARVGRICEINGQGEGGKYSSDTTAANARLIAAAPQLLTALVRAEKIIRAVHNPLFQSDLETITEAITEATGTASC